MTDVDLSDFLPPTYDLEPTQDFIRLAGIRSPGVCRIHNFSRERKIDARDNGYGYEGGSTVYIGSKLATFSVDFTLWHDGQWISWEGFREVLEPPKLPISLGLGIDHPILALVGVHEVIVKHVGAFEQDDLGGWTCTVDFIEFKPRKKEIVSKPIEAIPAATKAAPRILDAVDAETAAKAARLKALAAGNL